MATRVWMGRATAVAQVSTATITAYDAATTYAIIIGGVTVSVVGSGGTTTTVATALTTALNASTHPYFSCITWTSNAAVITGTADTAGEPFVFTTSESGGTGTIGDMTAGTANAGPNVWGTAANWSGETVPTGGDTIVYENSAVDCLWDLDQNGTTFAEVRIAQSYTGKLGLYDRTFRTAGAQVTTADEYRQAYFKAGMTLCNVGVASGSGSNAGSGRLRLDLHSVQSAVTVYSTCASATDGVGFEPVRIIGTHASNVITVQNGIVGIASQPNEAATFTRIGLGPQITSGVTSGVAPKLTIGSGCTLTTIDQLAGTMLNMGSNITTLNQYGGTHEVLGAATITTVNQYAGTFNHKSSGTIGTFNCSGTLDCSQDQRTKTITTLKGFKGCTINLGTARPLSVTLTNGLALQVGASLQNSTITFWAGTTLTPS